MYLPHAPLVTTYLTTTGSMHELYIGCYTLAILFYFTYLQPLLRTLYTNFVMGMMSPPLATSCSSLHHDVRK